MQRNNKISVFYDHILQAVGQTKRNRLDLLLEVKADGIDALEINYTALKEQYSDLARELKTAGLGISCIYETYLFGEDPDISRAKGQVDLAVKTGASCILVIPGFLKETEAAELRDKSGSYEETAAFMNGNASVQNMKQALTALSAYAKEKNVWVTLEDYDGLTAPYARKYQLKWFMEQIPDLRYTFDTGNFVFSDEDAMEAYALLKDSVVHVHCKDRGEEPEKEHGTYLKGLLPVPVGSGYMPMKQLVTLLLQDGYQGYLAIEHFDAPDQMRCIKESAQCLQKFISDSEAAQ